MVKSKFSIGAYYLFPSSNASTTVAYTSSDGDVNIRH